MSLNKPDTNTDWDYPPLTADEFESIFHYYLHDGGVFTSERGREYTLVVSIPIISEDCYKAIGHMVKLHFDPVDGGKGGITTSRKIKGKGALDALGDLQQALSFVNHRESMEAGE